MKNFGKNLAAFGAFAGIGFLFAGPTLVALGVGISIFAAPQVAALGFLAQAGLAIAGGFGAGLATRVLSIFTVVPLTAVLVVVAGDKASNLPVAKKAGTRGTLRALAPTAAAPVASAEAAASFNAQADAPADAPKAAAPAATVKGNKPGSVV